MAVCRDIYGGHKTIQVYFFSDLTRGKDCQVPTVNRQCVGHTHTHRAAADAPRLGRVQPRKRDMHSICHLSNQNF